MLDCVRRGAYGSPVASRHVKNPGGATDTAPHGKNYRRPPSPSEQARREAWGREWGPKVGSMIRKTIARAER